MLPVHHEELRMTPATATTDIFRERQEERHEGRQQQREFAVNHMKVAKNAQSRRQGTEYTNILYARKAPLLVIQP